jgi:hypothetical protein
MIRLLITALMLACLFTSAMGGTLFVGLEGSAPPTRSTDLSGFPDVTWDNHYSFDVSGAAATPDGDLYLCNGAFTTRLYRATLDESPTLLSTISVDISGMAYGRDTLYGFSNYADPKGIYSIDPGTGQATLVLDVYTGYGFRFFGLGYNPVDDLFYGYTEYGDYGLYSINIDTGEMIKLASSIPASNGQGRGLAVGNNTVYLTATRGDDGIQHFAYDIAQGVGGVWVGFTNAYPAYHSTGGAAFIPSPTDVGESDLPGARMLLGAFPNPFNPRTNIRVELEEAGSAELTVFLPTGQKVATIFDGQMADGSREFTWDGRDDAGRQMASGVYMVQMSSGGRAEMLKLVLLR